MMNNKKEIKKDLQNYAKIVGKEKVTDNGYFYDLKDNLFEGEMPKRFVEMFMKGDGNELVSKACAVHSSSMLGYNFFHWIDKDKKIKVSFEDKDKREIEMEYDEVLFEVQVPVLKRGKPANMDIVLRNESGDWLFLESKFLEYLTSNSFKISESYKTPESYKFYENDQDLAKKWADFIKDISKKNTDKKQYWEGIKQEICHLIGLTNWIKNEIEIEKVKFERVKDVRFIHLIFEPKKGYEKEYECFESYKERYDELIKKLEDCGLIPGKLKMKFMTYTEMFECVKKSNNKPDKLVEYLQEHYMKYANK